MMTIHDQHVSQEIDQTESTQNKKRKSTKSSTSSMTKFLSSIEIITYRSLVQKEYNSIVDEEKEYNVMQFWQQNQSQIEMFIEDDF
ncbi:unnamed protein product [Rotaria magnacalcarata]|uniref:Uncharacterized protein n=1 Tax=Rotaria magnacalcarata TaxID=392030 RepID=A0A820BXH2_9BILA|nr:unnamed protein product [Rotaria magnacalcarata]CAF1680833.1 unnamed protein product [Rotaria magnacalcarata]CAF1987714.1 unnamed protein product [Rotaria magnacalcarata]CAF2100483.1 unnamed protein product [Rotaria magnacalcarata]CAF4195431.1 unnamed protein product [Rotaria magnacalcarata]